MNSGTIKLMILSAIISLVFLITFTLIYKIILSKIINSSYIKQKKLWNNKKISFPYKIKSKTYIFVIFFFSCLYILYVLVITKYILEIILKNHINNTLILLIIFHLLIVIVFTLLILRLFFSGRTEIIFENDQIIEKRLFFTKKYSVSMIKNISISKRIGDYKIIIEMDKCKIILSTFYNRLYEFEQLLDFLTNEYKKLAI